MECLCLRMGAHAPSQQARWLAEGLYLALFQQDAKQLLNHACAVPDHYKVVHGYANDNMTMICSAGVDVAIFA